MNRRHFKMAAASLLATVNAEPAQARTLDVKRDEKALLGPNTGTIVAASMMLAVDNNLPLHKIVTRKAGVDHSTRAAKDARKTWRKNRKALGKPEGAR